MVTVEEIKKITEKECLVEDMGIRSKEGEPLKARYVYYKLAKKYTSSSLYKIGKNAGKRAHSTVLAGIKQFDLKKDDKDFLFYFEAYKRCCLIIRSKIVYTDEIDELKTVGDYKSYYNKKIDLMEEDHKEEIDSMKQEHQEELFKYKMKLKNLDSRPIFKEIALWDEASLDIFEARALAFRSMNKPS
jgi:hypothetical protein